MPRLLATIAVASQLCSCASYRGGGQSVKTVGSDGASLSLHLQNFDQSASLTQVVETITAAWMSAAAAATANSAIKEIKR